MTDLPQEETPYVTITKGIKISVWPQYSPEQSRPSASLYVYLYTIHIQNEGKDNVQLLSRHWIIKDGFNRIEEVRGEGVVGQQPKLAPGESFRYTSSCPLQTPTGSMQGTYTVKGSDQKNFDVKIGEFFLAHKSLLN